MFYVVCRRLTVRQPVDTTQNGALLLKYAALPIAVNIFASRKSRHRNTKMKAHIPLCAFLVTVKLIVSFCTPKFVICDFRPHVS